MADDWNALVEMVQANDLRVTGSGLSIQKTAAGTTIRATSPPAPITIAKTSSTISVRSGTAAGSGTVTPQKFDGTNLSNDGSDVTAYLFSASATIASGKYCAIAQDANGYWWIIAVEC